MFAMLLTTAPAWAKIYTWKDADGNTVYSDRPAENATEVQLHKAQTFTPRLPASPPAKAPTSKETQPTTDSYQALTITEPADDQAQWASNGQVDVVVAINPPLNVDNGDYLSIAVDGTTRIAKSSDTHMTLTNVDRGTHQMTAAVHAANGATLRTSQAITFHIHRPSLLNK